MSLSFHKPIKHDFMNPASGCFSRANLYLWARTTYISRIILKKITYGRYSPPIANTVMSELVKLYSETELKVIKIIADYKEEGLLVSISTDIWGEDGKSCRL